MLGGRGGQDSGQGTVGGGRGRVGFGPGGYCICQNCGYKEKHQRTVPCYNKKCPKCETPLTRLTG